MGEFSTLNGFKVKDKKATRYYDNVSLMLSDTTLKEGMHVITKGYSNANDGGGSEYYISSLESATEYQEELTNGLYANLIIRNNSVNVKQFGVISLEKINAILELPIENYYFKNENIEITDAIILQSNKNLYFENFNITNTNNENKKYILNSDSKENINIYSKNSTFKFNKPSTEQQAVVRLKDSINIVIDGLDIEKAGGDGIIISGTDNETISENITINNCIIDDNRRNGIALIGGLKNVKITNCKLTNTSGANPQCGIDIETWQDGIYNDTILIDNCHFEGNVNTGLNIWPYTKNLIISNNKFIGTGISSVLQVAKGQNAYPKNVKISNNYFETGVLYLKGVQYAEYVINSNVFKNGARIMAEGESDMTNFYSSTELRKSYLIVKDNLIIGSTSHGISIGGSCNAIVDGNTIIEPTNRGIVSSGSNNVKIINNTIIDHAQTETTPESVYAIYVTTTHNVSIINNSFFNKSETIFTRLISIAASVDYILVTNNQAKKINYTNFIGFDGTTANRLVDNNLINQS